MRLLMTVEAKGVQTPYVLNAKSDWRVVAEAVRVALAEQVDGDRCGSVVVAVHFQDERCDHEVG